MRFEKSERVTTVFVIFSRRCEGAVLCHLITLLSGQILETNRMLVTPAGPLRTSLIFLTLD
jgi:hypothetical protein